MDDSGDRAWEDAAFNTRHLHNHLDRGGRPGNVRHEFKVKSTMGTHLVKCAALEKLQQQQQQEQQQHHSPPASPTVVLEIYRLTDQEDGLLGSLRAGNVFEATVAFAGSRKTLGKITRELVAQSVAAEEQAGAVEDGQEESDASSVSGNAKDGDNRAHNSRSPPADQASDNDEDEQDDSEADDDDSDDEGDAGGRTNKRRRQRAAAFEKNSFRQPKFWFRWQGGFEEDTTSHADDDALDGPAPRESRVHGSGYLVFANNDCRRFQGTLTSEQFGWNNVKMNGWRTRPQPERDFEICWTGEH
ncbi:hypothetical protein BD289DRAFT_377393 [Coniella lustricola]|uniref:Uncharacterized protein n=1 Tax=Coniella lustricola TaxID=2025994 RepID=A0A2T2ZVJ1_9PEZI|nr:hypothetical protein BD289DRAFT_377393 [Coniella lustricola]